MERDYLDSASRTQLPGVEPLIANRWSPRAYLAEPVSEADLTLVFEAARLSQSCFNEQPWHFYTSMQSSRDDFIDLLAEANQAWARSAPVIGFVTASRHFQRNGKENAFAAFDSGAAWMGMSLQARALGLYSHGMGGINFEQVYTYLELDPQQSQVICGFTLGRLDSEGDEALSARKTLAATWTAVSGA